VSEKLIYLGKFGETLESSEDSYIKEAEMFSVGVHRGVEYTEDDIEQLVNEFNAEDRIPLQLDHSESARDTVGFLKEASSADGKLMGKIEVLDEEIQKKIDKGLLGKLSVSFYLKHTEEGFKPHKLREVSLVAFPQVKGARLFSENGYVSEYEEQKGGEKDMSKEKETAKFSDEQVEQLMASYKEMEKKLDKLAGVQEKFTETQVTYKIEKFQEGGKVVPAQVDSLTKLLGSFSEEQAGLFDEFMKNSAKVDLSEKGEVEDPEHEEDKKEKQSDFDKFYEEHTKQYGTSL
jgi:hypothetical protein